MDSTTLSLAWAKTDSKRLQDPSAPIGAWLPLTEHLTDTAEVMGWLWDHWVSGNTRDFFAAAFGSYERCRSILVWFAAHHDVGKLSPAFAMKNTILQRRMAAAGLPFPASHAGDAAGRGYRHELVSAAAVVRHLEQLGIRPTMARAWASVAASHHGTMSNIESVSSILTSSKLAAEWAGDSQWEELRSTLLEDLRVNYLADATPVLHSQETPELSTLMAATGLVILADWIASDQDYFSLIDLQQASVTGREQRAATAMAEIALPEPVTFPERPAGATGLLQERFGFGGDSEANPMQEAVVEIATQVSHPGIMIIESEMGSGKTEAALMAAEILATRFSCSGIITALPTMATADAYLTQRLADWSARLPEEHQRHISLIHSKSNERQYGLTEHPWMQGAKRQLTAPYVATTIDQILLMTLASRGFPLRHAALMGKVVVIDEAHESSAYSSAYLDRALEWFGAYGVPVIILSATLPSSRRAAMTNAYLRGAGGELGEVPLVEYPRVTHVSPKDAPVSSAIPAASSKTIAVQWARQEDAEANIAKAVRERGVAAVVRNTVADAQATAKRLREHTHADVDVVTLHSRFPVGVRLHREEEALRLVGKHDPSARAERLIVVATQVIESSLDIDFDVMATDLAPIAQILQRSGRMHRHRRDGTVLPARPAHLAAPTLTVIGERPSEEAPPEISPQSAGIYSTHELLATAAVLRAGALRVPADVGGFVEAVESGDVDAPQAWRTALNAALRARSESRNAEQMRAQDGLLRSPTERRSLGLLGAVEATAPDPVDSTAQLGQDFLGVRGGVMDLEVLLLQHHEGQYSIPEWMPDAPGELVPFDAVPSQELTAAILACAIKLPKKATAGKKLARLLDDNDRSADFKSWRATGLPAHARPLRRAVVLTTDREGRLDIAGTRYRYDVLDGLMEEPERKEVQP